LDDLPDRHLDVVTILGRVRLRRLAPATVKQDVGGLHARGCWNSLLTEHPGQHLDALLGVAPSQRPQIGWKLLSGQLLMGWTYPPPYHTGSEARPHASPESYYSIRQVDAAK